MLKRNKAFSIIMTLCLCLALLAPVFVAPQAAEAATTYSVLSAPEIQTIAGAKDLGVIKVTLPDTAIAAYSIVTVSMPSDLRFTANGDTRPGVFTGFCGAVPVIGAAPAAGGGIAVVAPGPGTTDGLIIADFKDNFATDGVGAGGYFPITPNNTFDIQLQSPIITTGADKFFYIYFYGVDLNNISGDIAVTMLPPSGSAFSLQQNLVIAKTVSSGSTLNTCKKVVNLTDAGGPLDIITVHENSGGTLVSPCNIKLEILTKGFKFSTPGATTVASYGWDFGNNAVIPGNLDPILPAMINANNDLLTYPVLAGVNAITTPGKISFVNLALTVDDTKATPGDEVEIKVSGDNVTSQTIAVAKYVDYGVTVEEGTTKELIAGQTNQEIGEFYIKEGARASLINNRIVSLTLPTGCEWFATNTGDYDITNSSNLVFNGGGSNYPTRTDSNKVLKWEVTTQSTNDGAALKFKDFKISVSPDFTGPVEVKVAGSAGAEGTVKVAEVKPAATIEVENMVNVELGKPNQKIDDLVIVEGMVKGLLDNAAPGNQVILNLDTGYRFSKTPTVEVIEGDIDISTSSVTVNGGALTFDIQGQSAKTASKIKISDVYIDAYRTAPEGTISIEFAAGISALNENPVSFINKSPGKYAIANCVTPSMKQGTEGAALGQFKIGSNIYEVDGIAKVMDTAPYIKNNRTYVPIRYMGYALGLTDNDIVWDEANRKATLTQGDNVVELTIGSTTIVVNGESQTMDVAPEINNNRTMLPARYVAEGLGYVVGWDPGTRTVLISK